LASQRTTALGGNPGLDCSQEYVGKIWIEFEMSLKATGIRRSRRIASDERSPAFGRKVFDVESAKANNFDRESRPFASVFAMLETNNAVGEGLGTGGWNITARTTSTFGEVLAFFHALVVVPRSPFCASAASW